MPVVDPAGNTTAMPAESVSKWTGLLRFVDPFAVAPGAMAVADNVVIPGPSLLQPRRGFRAGTSLSRQFIRNLSFFGPDALLVDDNTTTAHTVGVQDTSVLATSFPLGAAWAYTDLDLTAGTLLPYGYSLPGMVPPSRFFPGNGNEYMLTNFGAIRFSSLPGVLASSPYDLAGAWPPASFSAGVITGTQTLLPAKGATVNGVVYTNGSQVAYRATVEYTDAAGNVHVSPPTPRLLVNNKTAGGLDVAPIAQALDWVPLLCTIKFWRTFVVPISATYPDVAGDEMFLVYQTTGNYGRGATVAVATFNDSTPSVPWLQIPLYTNPSTGDVNGLGIGNANTPPPLAYDAFQFKDRYYYCNTQEVERLELQIIGTGTGGIVDGDTFLLGGYTFYFHDSTAAIGGGLPTGTIVTPLYRIGGAFDFGTQEANIQATATQLMLNANLVGCGYASNFSVGGASTAAILSKTQLETHFRLDAISSPTGIPGLILTYRLVPGAPALTAVAGTGAGRGWAGLLAANNTSDHNRQPANLMQSQPDDPESVPPAFTNTIGALDKPILRGLGLRDSAFLFKGGGDGLWKFIDDGTGSLTIAPLDQTVHCVAPKTAVVLNNAAYALCDKGVLRITDGGSPENVSNERIQADLAFLMANAGPAKLAELAFAVAYEAERLFILCLPESSSATTCEIQYVYNELTDAWTRWTIPALLCGAVNPTDGKLYFGRDIRYTTGNPLWVERKDFTDNDYQDESLAEVVPGAGTYTAAALTFTGDVTGTYAVGDIVNYTRAGIVTMARITAVALASGAGSTLVTLDRTVTFTAGDAFTLLKGIRASVQLLPLVAGEPLYEKQWQNAYFFFRYTSAEQFDVAFSTEKQAVPQHHVLAGQSEYPWLYSETLGFGLQAWGSSAKNAILKMAFDQAAARSAELGLQLSCGDALASWELSALRIPYDPTTMRVVR